MSSNTIEIHSKFFIETIISCIVAITVIAIILSVFSMYSVLIIAFGILPGLVAVIVDQEKERYISRIVLTYNCIGMAPYIVKVLRAPSSSMVSIEIIANPETWLVIFGSAAFGWIVYWFFPQTITTMNNLRIDMRIKQLEAELTKLSQEWGEEICRIPH